MCGCTHALECLAHAPSQSACRDRFEPFGGLKSAINEAAEKPGQSAFEYVRTLRAREEDEVTVEVKEKQDYDDVEVLYFAFDILYADGQVSFPSQGHRAASALLLHTHTVRGEGDGDETAEVKDKQDYSDVESAAGQVSPQADGSNLVVWG